MRDLQYQGFSPATSTDQLLAETFEDDRRAGTVIGSRSPDGVRRLGVDRERRMAIDHGALRFQPLITPGWARQGIAYGPFPREAGLALAVALTNGHNTSEVSSIDEGIARRIWRWVRGPGIDPIPQRLLALLRGPRKRGLVRRFRGWLRLTPRFFTLPDLDENLAVGWFGSATPADPTADGCGFVVHAALGDNGELWARQGGRCLPALRGLKNVQIYYIVVLRAQGALCYAAAGPEATALPAMPMMRPIAVDPWHRQEEVFAGIHQSILGQIGFRVDTRVHGIRIERLPELALAGPGQLGDALTRSSGSEDPGPDWEMLRGEVRLTGRGAACGGSEALAVLRRSQETGLVHAMIELTGAAGAAGLVWRVIDARNYWLLELGSDAVRLIRFRDGVPDLMEQETGRALPSGTACSIQVTDAAGQLGCYLDGERLFGRWIADPGDEGSTRAGFWLSGKDAAVLRDFECHPRAVQVPEQLRFPGPWRRFGSQVVVSDRFSGPDGPVDGRIPASGPGPWQRLAGCGGLWTTGNGARVEASVEAPHPGRTFHAVPWASEGFADLETVILPPGSGRGEKHHCRSGLLFWQDDDNYLSFSIYLSDEYHGASVALFTKRHGFEELYDAIWTMVGDSITWGRPFRLRICCDGNRFAVFLDGEAVMERALSDLYPDDAPLRIRAVGLATNWEWGDDTGSTFQEFVARV
ncbi:hypothetical protein [Amaricoccus sp.]|mgnify:CR=1 FL=1|uniref:hypothetical protein n=2 Tax=Amaricoccus sp. TaxID=1872485 RepID=UPI002C7745AB|nr:hypothetical protein [Amaricoccus sp.]HMR59072.1 hypothetical protein [Amaricoccus sp.]